MKRLQLAIVALGALLYSCAEPETKTSPTTQDSPETEQEATPIVEDTLIEEVPEAEVPFTPITEWAADTMKWIAKTSPEIKGEGLMMEMGKFPINDIDLNEASGPWLGLYKAEGGSELRAVSITQRELSEKSTDMEGNPITMVELSVDDNEGLILCLANLDLTAGSVTEFSNERKIHWPGDSSSFKIDDMYLLLYATGFKNCQTQDRCVPANYRFHATYGGTSQELMSYPGFDDTQPEIIWMGDLDRDGIPDLLMECSPKYSYSNVVLFLSSKADPGKVFKAVASIFTASC